MVKSRMEFAWKMNSYENVLLVKVIWPRIIIHFHISMHHLQRTLVKKHLLNVSSHKQVKPICKVWPFSLINCSLTVRIGATLLIAIALSHSIKS